MDSLIWFGGGLSATFTERSAALVPLPKETEIAAARTSHSFLIRTIDTESPPGLHRRVAKEKGRKQNASGRRRKFSSTREAAGEGVALLNPIPGQIQSAAGVGGQFGKGRAGAIYIGERRIECFLVAAEMVFGAQTTSADFNQLAGFDRSTTSPGTGADGHFHRSGLDLGDLLDQAARQRASEVDQRSSLFGGGHPIHDQHGLATARLVVQVAQ